MASLARLFRSRTLSLADLTPAVCVSLSGSLSLSVSLCLCLCLCLSLSLCLAGCLVVFCQGPFLPTRLQSLIVSLFIIIIFSFSFFFFLFLFFVGEGGTLRRAHRTTAAQLVVRACGTCYAQYAQPGARSKTMQPLTRACCCRGCHCRFLRSRGR